MKCFNPLIARYNPQGWFNKDNPDKPKKLSEFMFVKNMSKDDLMFYKKLLDHNQAVILPCGDCFACRSKQRLSWVIRNTFEANKYKHNVFLTLTYNDKYCPTFLNKSDLQGFIKRLRINLVRQGYLESIKYFACGEYGGKFGRPHYHAILYNMPDLQDKVFIKNSDGYRLYSSKIIDDSWSKRVTYDTWESLGIHTISEVTDESIKYCCGYVQKKLNKRLSVSDRKKLHEWLEKHDGLHFVDNFILASKGIGMEYFNNHAYELFANDELLFHSNNHTIITKPVPYFDYLLKKEDSEIYQFLKDNRKGFFDYSKLFEDDRSLKQILEAEEEEAFKKYNLKLIGG